MKKIPAITLSFWIIKICATTLGETGGDMLSMTLNIGYAMSSLMLISVFFLALGSQLMSKTFHPWLFWTVILSTSTVGTTISDYIDRTLGLGYVAGSAILITLLGCVFMLWRALEGSRSVTQIQTRRAEIFYWVAILISNTLGTAFGDFLSDSASLGFSGGALLVGSSIFLISLAYFYTQISRTLLFWMAFILTRPLGATVGDLLTKPHEKGGFDLGTIGSSGVLGAIMIGLIIYDAHQTSRRTEANPSR